MALDSRGRTVAEECGLPFERGAGPPQPPVAYAHWSSVLTYAQGVDGIGGAFGTNGFDHRHFNRVYRAAGYTWCVWSRLSDASIVAQRCNTSNPTEWSGEIGYAKAQCHYTNDTSGVTWTCQTTQ